MVVLRDTLTDVIQAQKLIRVRHGGKTYVVEPYCYGRLWTGEEAIRVYVVQREKDAYIRAGWNLLKVVDLEDIEELNGFFDGERSEFDPHDPAMYFIFCRVEKALGSFQYSSGKLPLTSKSYSYSWQTRVN
jgi:hypothetical protein